MKMTKEMNNLEIADLLRAVAASYELRDAIKNKFRIVAYERAADAVEHLSSEAKDIWDEGKLEDIPGVGPSIAEHLDEIFRTGNSKHFAELMKDFPPLVFDLMELPKIGPKTAFKIVKEYKARTIEDLKGTEYYDTLIKSQKKIKRYLLPYAQEIADELIAWMKKSKYAIKIDPLGSLRRKASTVGDIDISVATNNPEEVIKHFVSYPKSKKNIERGTHTASILLPGEVQIDLMVQPAESYGSLLQHFTGSKHHNIALREFALKKGFSLSEYGIKEIKNQRAKIKSFRSEKEFYEYIGMEWIPPELREDAGEIESAINHELPHLIGISDVKADLQIHSDFDIETSHDLGESSMEDLVKKANGLGYEYIAFTEHNPSKSRHNEKQIMEILKRKKARIEQLNYSIVKHKYNCIKYVFNSLEIDLTSEGERSIPDSAMELLDFALVSIHSNFDLSEDKMTKRVLIGLNHPKAKIFAHPTARKLNEREGVELNWPEIFNYVLKNNKWIEINADPMRLDLPDNLVREAVKRNVKLTLGTDSHHADMLDNMIYGVFVARRGWAEKSDIINTKSLEEFKNLLGRG